MLEVLDVADPVVEDSGSSLNPFQITGIAVGVVVFILFIIFLIRRKK